MFKVIHISSCPWLISNVQRSKKARKLLLVVSSQYYIMMAIIFWFHLFHVKWREVKRILFLGDERIMKNNSAPMHKHHQELLEEKEFFYFEIWVGSRQLRSTSSAHMVQFWTYATTTPWYIAMSSYIHS